MKIIFLGVFLLVLSNSDLYFFFLFFAVDFFMGLGGVSKLFFLI